jgi:hypothetical protein
VIYLASPRSQLHAHVLSEAIPPARVLLSYSERQPCTDEYVPAFGPLLIDSGAYAAMTSGKPVDLRAYIDWQAKWAPQAEAVAGLDVIADPEASLRNYAAFPGGFPTYHLSDPPELLPDLLALCRERKHWLGLGMCGQRKHVEPHVERWLRDALARVPDGVHVHLWAGVVYTFLRRIDSTDTTAWTKKVMDLGTDPKTAHLSTAERLEIAVKYYQRRSRMVHKSRLGEGPGLFDGEEG